MSMMPRKKPEGLIDGCFGLSAYCDDCKYAKEFGDLAERLCRSCRAKRALPPIDQMMLKTIEDSTKGDKDVS